MRYIYFDADGVLNTSADWKIGNGRLNKEAVKNFCQLVKKHDLTPIITSSWRTGFLGTGNPENSPQIKALEGELGKYGVLIKDKTPITRNHSRDEEIQYYQSRHPSDGYIIIDDDESEYKVITDRNYFTDCGKGLTKEDIKNISKML